jgi:hypothetical protein
MENNEDKRTPIQQEIERIQTELKDLRRYEPDKADKILRVRHGNKVILIDAKIKLLQSLLEPEKEALIKARKSGMRYMWDDNELSLSDHKEYDDMALKWFTSTYTQQTKQDGSDI